MKKFKDLKFEIEDPYEYNHTPDEWACLMFPNEYGISVVRGPSTYGGKKGLYEAAVIIFPKGADESEICWNSPIGDVHGYLHPYQVTLLMKQIQKLPLAG
jgi:hypothetical protein